MILKKKKKKKEMSQDVKNFVPFSTLWAPKSDQHLISPYKITPG